MMSSTILVGIYRRRARGYLDCQGHVLCIIPEGHVLAPRDFEDSGAGWRRFGEEKRGNVPLQADASWGLLYMGVVLGGFW